MAFRTSSQISRHLKHFFETSDTSTAKRRRIITPDGAGAEVDASGSRSPSLSSPAVDLQGYGSQPENDSDGYAGDLEENNENNGDEQTDQAVPHPIYSRGRQVYEDEMYKIFIKAVAHRRQTRFSLSDHLFTLWIETKPVQEEPFLLDLEEALQKALVHVLDRLKDVYNASQNQNQVYITVIEKHILNGINSGNYSLNTPSIKIARWVLSMLYHYLKSNQTIRLNDSFKIQIKVLSLHHTRQLESRKREFTKHVYH